MEGGFTTGVREGAKLSDLVVFGSSAPEGGPDIAGAFIETLTHSGRPVLLAPREASESLTPKIVIGWDGSAAAAHAMSAALPLLASAGAVELYMVKAPGDGGVSPDDALEYLSLHGIEATPRVFEAAAASPGDVLLRQAEDAGASLIVLGGYGHSRLFETLFGGTTVHVTAHSTLPLFMVH
jgi:nucleotide-binding universal stress UspA family protein